MENSFLIEYKTEQQNYKKYSSRLRIWAYINLFLFLFFLFVTKNLDPKFYFLWIYSVYSSLSQFILIYTYRIPKLFLEFLKTESDEIYFLVDTNRELIYKKFLKEIYGVNFTEIDLNDNKTKMLNRIKEFTKFDWRKLSYYYFIIYFINSILIYLYIFYDFNQIEFK